MMRVQRALLGAYLVGGHLAVRLDPVLQAVAAQRSQRGPSAGLSSTQARPTGIGRSLVLCRAGNVQLPAGVAGLDAGLAHVERDGFAHCV